MAGATAAIRHLVVGLSVKQPEQEVPIHDASSGLVPTGRYNLRGLPRPERVSKTVTRFESSRRFRTWVARERVTPRSDWNSTSDALAGPLAIR